MRRIFLALWLAVAWLLALPACKPLHSAQLTSLENFAAQSLLKRNACRGGAAGLAAPTTEKIVAAASDQAGASPAIRVALANAVAALPEELRRQFLDTGSQIKITDDLSTACASPATDAAPAFNTRISGCFEAAGDGVILYLKNDVKAIEHETVRQFGYAYFQNLRFAGQTAVDDALVEATRQHLNDVARGFFSDLVYSPFLAPSTLRDLLGPGGEDVVAAGVAVGLQDIVGALELSDARKYQLISYVNAEAFDSYFCGADAAFDPQPLKALAERGNLTKAELRAQLREVKNTRALMALLFPSTYRQFTHYAKASWPALARPPAEEPAPALTTEGAARCRADSGPLDRLSAEGMYGSRSILGAEPGAAAGEDVPAAFAWQGVATGVDPAAMVLAPNPGTAAYAGAASQQAPDFAAAVDAIAADVRGLYDSDTFALGGGGTIFKFVKRCFGFGAEVSDAAKVAKTAKSAPDIPRSTVDLPKVRAAKGGGLSSTVLSPAKDAGVAKKADDFIERVAAEPELAAALRDAGVDLKNIHNDVLGAGSFGIVVRSTDGESVVKVPTSGNLSMREATILRKLSDDPGVGTGIARLKFYDQKTGVMQLENGGTSLEQLTKAGRLSPAQLDEVMNQVEESLAKVHKAGYVHGDIKPDNIAISIDPATKQVKARLIDFGLANKVGDPFVGGSPRYLPPDVFFETYDVKLKKFIMTAAPNAKSVPNLDWYALEQVHKQLGLRRAKPGHAVSP